MIKIGVEKKKVKKMSKKGRDTIEKATWSAQNQKVFGPRGSPEGHRGALKGLDCEKRDPERSGRIRKDIFWGPGRGRGRGKPLPKGEGEREYVFRI